MPYCPKCDMEFVEGVQVCSDCGGPLLASPEEAQALKKEAEQKALEEFLARAKEEGFSLEEGFPLEEGYSTKDFSLENEDLSDTSGEENLHSARENSGTDARTEIRKKMVQQPSSVYVKKSERYQDMKSSASAFLLIGCVAVLLSALIFTGILPIAGSSKISFGGILGVMGIACLVVCLKTNKEAARIKGEAAQENQETQELISWFLQAHSAEELDRQLAEEQGGEQNCTPEELSLKRFSLIQDYLITEKDLPDPAYVEALSEEIYSRLFE